MTAQGNYRDRFKWLLRLTTYLGINSALLIGGLALCILATGWPQAVGTSLVASALVGLLFLYQLRIDRQFDQARQTYEDFGLITVTGPRSDKDLYRRHMMRCRSSFDIMGHSLSRLYDDLGRDLLPEMDSRGVKIRILLLDPDSPLIHYREKEEPSPERVNLSAEIRKAAECYMRLGLSNLKIRYYDCTPTVTYQRLDSVVFAAPYFVGISSGRQSALVLRSDQDLAIAYQTHFEYVWERLSRDVK